MQYITTDSARIIDGLRHAAKMYPAVFDLLAAIDDGILIDGCGNKEVIAEGQTLEMIQSAQVARAFARLDAGQS